MATEVLVAAAPDDVAPRKRSWALAILVLALAITNAAAMRGVFSPLQDFAKHDLHLTDIQLGVVQGVSAAATALLAFPLGRLVDRTRRVTLMAVMSAIWSAGTIWTAFAGDFGSLFLARMLASLGALCAVVVSISLVADMTTPQTRGRATMVLTIGIQAGTAIAFLVGGLLAPLSALPALNVFHLVPWREAHLVFGLASVALTFPILFLSEPERHEISGDPALGPALKTLWGLRGFLIPLFVGQVGVVMADVAAQIWAAPVLMRSYHQTPAQFGQMMGLVLMVPGLAGALLGGVGADLGQKLRFKGGVLLAAVIPALIAIPAAAFPVMPNVDGFFWMFGALIFAGSAAGIVTATAIAVIVPNEARGVCLGVFVVVASVVGFGVAPTLVTLTAKALGGEGWLAQSLAVTGVAIDVASGAGFLLAMLNLRKVAVR
jgi:MFS family permease